MKENLYKNNLLSYTKLPIIIAIVVLTIVFIFFLWTIKNKCIRDFIVYFAMALLTICVCVGFIVIPIFLDIKNQSYITYSGNYYVEDYYIVSRGSSPYILIKFEDDEKVIRYRIIGDYDWIEGNEYYNGTIVYGKRSKTILDINGIKIKEDF